MAVPVLALDASVLPLDPRIRDWVLIPIFVVMLLQGILRHYMTITMQPETKVALTNLTVSQLMRRSQRLRAHQQFLSPSSFAARRAFLLHHPKALGAPPSEEDEKKDQESDPSNPLDPMNAASGMKQQLAMIVPNMLQMGWVSYFFSGFVVVKLPFPLTDRFKAMLQRGVMLKTLDTSYVSSLSWLFLNMFGLRGVFALLLGSNANTGDDERMVKAMANPALGMGMGLGQQKPNYEDMYKAERNELDIVDHTFVVPQAEFSLISAECARSGRPVPDCVRAKLLQHEAGSR